MMRPLFHTEIGASGAVNKACRTASICNAVMLATRQEAALTRSERHRGKAGRLATVKRGWRAFLNQTPPDSNGWADQGDTILQMRAMFGRTYPDPIVTSARPEDVWDNIEDFATCIAIDTSAVPASDPIRRYVGAVPHTGMAWRRKIVNGVRWVKWVCPMHPRSDVYDGHWVKWSSLRQAARAISGDEMLVEMFPKDDWTKARLVAETLRRKMRKERQEAAAIIAEQRRKIAELEAVNDKAAGWEAGLVAGIDALQALRTDGPP